jgi:hypothetical protein
VYIFWQGWDPRDMEALGRLFKTSHTTIGLGVVQPHMKYPTAELESLCFGALVLHKSFPVRMAGN